MTAKPTVVEALAAVADEVREVRKDSRNQSQNFSFRGIDAVMNAVGPAFRKHGVLCLPVTDEVRYEPMPLASGKQATRCVVTVRYVFHGPAGDTIEAVVAGESFDMGDKATAKAYSVAYRTCLLQTLTIPTDDPDPDHDVYERAPSAPQVPAGPLASREVVDMLTAALAGLSDDELAQYGEWRKANNVPSLKRPITEEQADAIAGWLDDLKAGAPFTEEGEQ